MILGYTLTTFPKKLNTDKRNTNREEPTNTPPNCKQKHLADSCEHDIYMLCTDMASLVSHILLCGLYMQHYTYANTVFFIRYQKTMQAMLMAFITTNTSNSGIPSAKANPISRTFPPLFMIKISEEEKIAEDLHEIKSMQLIVQVIMIIVCILIAFIVMYYCCKKLRHTCTLFKYCFPFLPISTIL